MNELIDGNPKWEAAEEVGLRFLQMYISNGIEKTVDMNCGTTNRAKAFNCGTTSCHGGWYLLYSDETNADGFTEGADLMAEHLGFDEKFNLEQWGLFNPSIWGHSNPVDRPFAHYEDDLPVGMFHWNYNFEKPVEHKLTLKDISDHWMGVAERLWEIQVAGRLHELQVTS